MYEAIEAVVKKMFGANFHPGRAWSRAAAVSSGAPSPPVPIGLSATAFHRRRMEV